MNEEFLKQFMSDDYEIVNGTARKDNGVVLHSVSIKNNREKISPVFYLDGYQGIEPEVAAQQIVEKYREVISGDLEVVYYLDIGNDTTITIRDGMLEFWMTGFVYFKKF